MTFELSPEAAGNIDTMVEYILKYDIDAASRLKRDIERACELPGENSRIGHRREDLTKRDLRFWPVRHRLIVHRSRDPVEIVAVLDARRDLARLLG